MLVDSEGSNNVVILLGWKVLARGVFFENCCAMQWDMLAVVNVMMLAVVRAQQSPVDFVTKVGCQSNYRQLSGPLSKKLKFVQSTKLVLDHV